MYSVYHVAIFEVRFYEVRANMAEHLCHVVFFVDF